MKYFPYICVHVKYNISKLGASVGQKTDFNPLKYGKIFNNGLLDLYLFSDGVSECRQEKTAYHCGKGI
jgi:hypothetical protein